MIARWVVPFLLASTAAAPASSRGLWPLEPDDEKHPVFSVIEYKRWPSGTEYHYIHSGIDVFGASSDDPSSSFVIVVADSIPTIVGCDELERGCSTERANGCWATLEAEGGSSYVFTYGHLDCGSYTESFLDAFEDDDTVTPSDVIGQLEPWPDDCNNDNVYPHHLHFELYDSTLLRLVSPTEFFAPFHSIEPPAVHEVILAKDKDDVSMTTGPWEVFPGPVVPGTCRVVAGDVDVLVKYSSRFRPDGIPRRGDNLGARYVRWRACGGSSPDCPWAPAYDWKTMDSNWQWANLYVEAAYSLVEPYRSESEFVCGDDVFYAIPTNIGMEGGTHVPSCSGAWSTVAAPVSPSANGQHFTLTVEVEDFGGGIASETVPICVAEEDGPGIAKLLVRDCDDDTATEPSVCDDDLSSPDITITPIVSTPGVPSGGVVRVCMRNVGNDSIPVTGVLPPPSVTINVIGRSSGASGTVTAGSTFSESYDRQVDSLPSRLGGTPTTLPWGPGEDRCTDIDWPPASAPADWNGYDLLEVSVAREGDDPNTHASVLWDNNRAAQEAAWESVSSVTGLYRTDVKLADDPAEGTADTRLVRIEMILDRNWTTDSTPVALPSTSPVPAPRLVEIQYHVGPGITFETVTGGTIIGTMDEATHSAWEPSLPLRTGDQGLAPPGTDRDPATLGARADVWRIVAVPQGPGSVTIGKPKGVAGAVVSAYVWPRGGGQLRAGPRFRVRILESDGTSDSMREIREETYRSLPVPPRRASPR